MKFLPICCIALILILSSCGTTSVKNNDDDIIDDKITEKDVEYSILTGEWKLISFKMAGENIDIVPDTAPNVIGINFDAPEDDIYPTNGFLGVNLFFNSSVEIKDNKKDRNDNKRFIGKGFSINNVATTLRTGPDEHIAFEEIFKDCLLTADTLSIIKNNTLIIYNTEKDGEMIFTRLED